MAAGNNIDRVAQRDLNQTSGRRWQHNVGQHISLFVAGVKDRVSLKLIPARGKVQVQAQSDAMALTTVIGSPTVYTLHSCIYPLMPQ